MDITIKSRSGKPTEDERAYLQRKLEKLTRYLDDLRIAHIDLARTQTRSSGEVHIVQATLTTTHGTMIRAEAQDPEFSAAVDSLHDTLQRQVTRYKDRHYRRGKGHGTRDERLDRGDNMESTAPLNGNGNPNGGPRLVKTKQFVYKPMDAEEAIEQMELLGHDFFVFTDARTDQVNVVYRRNDGDYGLIEQESA